MDQREKEIRRRLRDDFPHYARKCLKIRTKGGGEAPLTLNQAQTYVHDRIEAQLRDTGKVRALVLKGRQQGVSTYVEGRFYHRTTHGRGIMAFILTHQEEATKNLFDMVERYHDKCPTLVKPRTSKDNARELTFDRLDSGYRVNTAGSKGAGRSATIQLFHGSEVAYWPNAETHMAGALQAVPNAPGTEVILESTSDGPKGLFYEMCRAAQAGESEYILIFVPWYWQDEYRIRAPEGFTPTEEEQRYSEKCGGLDLEQIAWRRSKIVELQGVENFRREYPATVEEAFTADAKGALWKRDQIKATRIKIGDLPALQRIVVGVDPSASNEATSAETGIVVVGIGMWPIGEGKEELHGFVLNDHSLKGTPFDWGTRVRDVYRASLADKVVAEKNNGGLMVEHVLRTVPGAEHLPIQLVWASRGKVTRAEPIASLYQRGLIHHVGEHITLEDQMCTWKPDDKSPDRIDALVWGLWALFLEDEPEQEGYVVYDDPVVISEY